MHTDRRKLLPVVIGYVIVILIGLAWTGRTPLSGLTVAGGAHAARSGV